MKKVEIEQDELDVLIDAAIRDEDLALHQRVLRGAAIAETIKKYARKETPEDPQQEKPAVQSKTPFPDDRKQR